MSKTIKILNARITRLAKQVASLQASINHWGSEFSEGLFAAIAGLEHSSVMLDRLPRDFEPPRKPLVRSYTSLAVGDECHVGKKSEKRTPPEIIGKTLTVAEILPNDYVIVTLNGGRWGLSLKSLLPGPAAAA